MMNTRPYIPTLRTLARVLLLTAAVCLCLAPDATAQTTGGTQIQNRASASYSDGTNNYTTVSNTVTVTVANVAGLAITPDAGSVPTVVSGQTNVDFTFTVTNTSNIPTQVRFLQSGASIVASGPVTVQAAVIDLTNDGLGAGDTDIFGNAADVLSATLARNASLTVVVRVNVSAAAAAGAAISVRLGDAAAGGPTFDNQTANSSVNEVRTSTPTGTTSPVNGESEARGDISTTVQNDAQLRLNLNAPAGPVALGSNITYTWSLDNTGQRSTVAQTLAGAPAGSNTGVFVVAPVPVGTTFVSVTPPAGVTVLYSTSAITNDPLSALTVWTTTGFGVDPVSATQGFQLPTLLTQVGNVLVGPLGQPGAVGPTNNNDDYTNKTVSAAAIAGVAPTGSTIAASTVDFSNTLQNTGNANDTYTLTAPTVPAGFTVQISTDGGTTFTTVSGGGSTTLAVAFGASANFIVRVTAPAGNVVLTGYDTVIRARSGNTNTNTNDTIDRLYTGFLRLNKTFTVINGTGVGAATDAVPGADIEYTINYSNVSSSGGTNCVTLTASSIVISEDGNAAPNNWAATTTQVLAPAPSDSTTGVITDGTTSGAVTATTTFLKDSVPSLAPGASGNFKFRRKIN
ncbi:MAG: hypothetical protein LC754_17940 [Acidobacteria bacterium]|nr:hypothetical protein [Acidobacteriota bacterium]